MSVYDLVKEFTEAVMRLPFVIKVCYDELDEKVYTIIDAPGFDSNYRDPVYDMESDIIKKYPSELALSFRLINAREYGDNLIYAIPGDVKVIEERIR